MVGLSFTLTEQLNYKLVTMSDNEQKKDQPITVTFPSGRVANKIVNAVTSNKPIGVSRRSQYPYYKENYAKWVQKDVDKMIEQRATGNPLVYDYAVFCTAESNISELTLYARISQGVRFLVDNMDDQQQTYYKWYNDVEISKNKKLGGVAIMWKPEFISTGDLRPRLAEPVQDIPKWRRDLTEWLDGEQSEPFKKENLLLDIDTIKSLKAELEGVMGLFVSINSKSITIVKTL